MVRTGLFLSILLGFSTSALASQPKQEENSLGLQMAKRLASMENSRDLPSRAVWLSQRVAKNALSIAAHQVKPGEPPKRQKPKLGQ
jgi:hypothetical protein